MALFSVNLGGAGVPFRAPSKPNELNWMLICLVVLSGFTHAIGPVGDILTGCLFLALAVYAGWMLIRWALYNARNGMAPGVNYGQSPHPAHPYPPQPAYAPYQHTQPPQYPQPPSPQQQYEPQPQPYAWPPRNQ